MKKKSKECKKLSVVAVLGVVASTAAFAGSGNMAHNNANNNTMTEVMTIEQVRGLSDNSPVIVRGYLLRQNGENSYVFQDNTGTINVEIDEMDWNGMNVAPCQGYSETSVSETGAFAPDYSIFIICACVVPMASAGR